MGRLFMTLIVIAVAVACWAYFDRTAAITYGIGVMAGCLLFDVWTSDLR